MKSESQSKSKNTVTALYAENHRLGIVEFDREENRWKFTDGTVRDIVAGFTKPDYCALAESPKGLALARCTAKYMAAPQNADAAIDLITGRTSRTSPAIYAVSHALVDCHPYVRNANGFIIKEVKRDATRTLCYEGRPICDLTCRDAGYRSDRPTKDVVEACFFFPGMMTRTMDWVRAEGFEPNDTDTIKDLVRFYLVHILDDLAEYGDDSHEEDGFTVKEV